MKCWLFILFNKKVILAAIGRYLKLYRSNIMNNMNTIININIHQDDINDLLKINENLFISSSKDKTIKFVQLA